MSTVACAVVVPTSVFAGSSVALTKPSALDNVNVRMLLEKIKIAIEESCNNYLFESNDDLTRKSVVKDIRYLIEPYKPVLYDYRIICDERNNPQEVVDSNELHVDLDVKIFDRHYNIKATRGLTSL